MESRVNECLCIQAYWVRYFSENQNPCDFIYRMININELLFVVSRKAGISVAFVRQASVDKPGNRLHTPVSISSVDNPGGGAEALSNVRYVIFYINYVN